MSSGKISRGLVFTFDLVLSVITVVLSAVLLASYFAPMVNPNISLVFPFLGLLVPFLYVAEAVLALYWIIRWKRIVIVPLLVLFIGIGGVSRYFKLPLSRDYNVERGSGTIRIMSYNVAGFWSYGVSPRSNTMNDIKSYIISQNPDIICLQEFEVNNRYSIDDFCSGLEPWKFSHISYAKGDGEPVGWGLAIFSKFPITNKKELDFPNSTNSAQWADVIVRRDTLRLFNTHLQTTQVDGDDREYLGSDMLTDADRKGKVLGIVRKLGRNFRRRADQVDSLAIYMQGQDGSRVVCGDFNDTPMSYAYRVMKGPLTDAFREKGRGMVSTYKELYGVLRIDYIFHTDNYETVDYISEVKPWGDHNPVIVDIKRKPR